MSRSRLLLRLVACGALIGLAALTQIGCPTPVLVQPSVSDVILDVEAVITGTSEATRIESLHIWPRGIGTLIGFPVGETGFSIDHPAPFGTDAVEAVARMKGIATAGPLDILGTGRATLTLEPALTGSWITVEDGFGNTLPIQQMQIAFDVRQLGNTNLPERWTLTVPMSGSLSDTFTATFFGVSGSTQADFSVSMSGAGQVAATHTTGVTAEDVTLVSDPATTIRPVSGASIEFTDVP